MDKNDDFPVRKLLVDQRVTPQIFGTAMSKSGVTRGHQALWKGLLRWKELPSSLCLCFNLPRPNRTCWNCRRLKIHIISHHLTLKEKCRTSFETDVPYSSIFSHIFPLFSHLFHQHFCGFPRAELPSQRKGLASRSEFHAPAVPLILSAIYREYS